MTRPGDEIAHGREAGGRRRAPGERGPGGAGPGGAGPGGAGPGGAGPGDRAGSGHRHAAPNRKPPPLVRPRRWPRVALVLAAGAIGVGVTAGLLVRDSGGAGGRSQTTSVGTVPGPVGAAPSHPPGQGSATASAAARSSPGAAGSGSGTGSGAPGAAAGATGSERAGTGTAGGSGSGPVVVGPTGVPTAPAVPALRLTAGTVNLGSAQTTGSADLVADGGTFAFTVGSPPSWLTVSPLSGTVPTGQTEEIVVTIDRAAAPVGAVAATLPVRVPGGRGGGTLIVRASVAAGPTIGPPTVAPAVVYPAGCGAGAPIRPTVTVSVVDPVGLFGVSVDTTVPGGAPVTTDLTLGLASGSRSNWSGSLPASPAAGTVALDVVVTGLDGRQSQRAGSYPVSAGCPLTDAGAATPPVSPAG